MSGRPYPPGCREAERERRLRAGMSAPTLDGTGAYLRYAALARETVRAEHSAAGSVQASMSKFEERKAAILAALKYAEEIISERDIEVPASVAADLLSIEQGRYAYSDHYATGLGARVAAALFEWQDNSEGDCPTNRGFCHQCIGYNPPGPSVHEPCAFHGLLKALAVGL